MENNFRRTVFFFYSLVVLFCWSIVLVAKNEAELKVGVAILMHLFFFYITMKIFSSLRVEAAAEKWHGRKVVFVQKYRKRSRLVAMLFFLYEGDSNLRALKLYCFLVRPDGNSKVAPAWAINKARTIKWWLENNGLCRPGAQVYLSKFGLKEKNPTHFDLKIRLHEEVVGLWFALRVLFLDIPISIVAALLFGKYYEKYVRKYVPEAQDTW